MKVKKKLHGPDIPSFFSGDLLIQKACSKEGVGLGKTVEEKQGNKQKYSSVIESTFILFSIYNCFLIASGYVINLKNGVTA